MAAAVAVAVAVAVAAAAAATGSRRPSPGQVRSSSWGRLRGAEGYGGWLRGMAIEYIQPSSLSTPTLDGLCCTAGEHSPAGCAVRTGSRVVGEDSPAECTRDKPEAGKYSSASYLRHYPAGEYSLASYLHPYLLRWLGSTPRPRTCIATYSAGWGVLLGQFATTTYSAGWGVLLGLLLASLLTQPAGEYSSANLLLLLTQTAAMASSHAI